MIHIRTPKLVILATIAFAVSLLANAAHAESVSVSATLILASNDGQGVDASLKQHERALKVFPFNTFKKIGDGRVQLSLNESKSISFGKGQTVTISYLAKEGNQYRITTNLKQGAKTLVKTTVLANKGKPNAQGANNSGGSVPILYWVAN